MVRLGRRFQPEARHRKVYDRQYALYGRLYRALKPVFREFSSQAGGA